MLAVLLAACVGCHSSPSTPKSDGGLDTSQSEGGGDSSMMCTDNGTKNKDNGTTCSCDTQCKSGFCVDGVCCDKACTGTCMSCALSSSPGTCKTIPAGAPPRTATDCSKMDMSTCGFDGMCDGSGHCERWVSGTECNGGKCDGDAVTARYQCDGNGSCKQAASIVCVPFSCDPSSNKCFSTCSVDTDCVEGRQCVNGSCGPKMNGAACAANSECASEQCADGVCCNIQCTGACRGCAMVGHVGTCTPTAEGLSHPLCDPQDQSTCGTTGFCDGRGTCSKWPANAVCGDASCSGNTLEPARTCDGNGTCQSPDAQLCFPYRCTDNACTSSCTTATQMVDCADGQSCVNESCGLKPDGQACKADAECTNDHCVDGVCCENACTGACRSCALGANPGKCLDVAEDTVDPRGVCSDTGAPSCGTNGKCDGNGSCATYPVGQICAGEDCTNDVYTGPSTCNASGQCIKPNSQACNPYHCNANKCFGACTSNDQCIPPNSCGQNGKANSCGYKSGGADCSSDDECASTHCAQGKCCDKACTGACTACNLPASPGICTDVQSGADPQGLCQMTAQNTCGTTGMCAAGQCAKYSNTTVCKAASCEPGGPPSSALTPPSRCDGNGTCVTPIDQGCSPGRCDPVALMCVNTCTTNGDCTNPNTCVNGSCGLLQKGAPCSMTNQCSNGLTCNHDKVCCDQTCDGVCETCKPPGGAAGTCTPVGAGLSDPSNMCPTTAANTCGTNGLCSGNNTGTGLARCQDYPGSQSCGTQSCVDSTTGGPSILTLVSNCSGGGVCNTPATMQCGGGLYKCLDATQCRTSCNTASDCANGNPCNTVTHVCGTKQAQGAMCNTSADCISTAANCVDGVCCNSACAGACQACNLSGSTGTCTSVTSGTSDALCPAATGTNCGNTGLCASGGACAKWGNTRMCAAAMCSADVMSSIPAAFCNGADTCPTPTSVPCAAAMCSGSGASFSQTTAGTCSAGACGSGVTTPCGDYNCNGAVCKTSCMVDADCVNGKKCSYVSGGPAGTCTGRPLGQACTAAGDCAGGNCVDGVCCNSACAGACQACNASGTCSAVTSGTDPACAPTANACGNTGMCTTGTATAGTCAQAPATQACGGTCVGNVQTPAGTCTGSGACGATGAPCGSGFACAGDGVNCGTSCTPSTTTGCATGLMCAVDGMSCS